jgi:ElaB/YqjD/DUF883 family membrane-anchored ribosome-binding protein
MKSVLALVTLALVTLVLEEKGRQVAGEAQDAYGEAVGQAREATESVRRNVERQPLAALAIAGAIGYVLAMFIPRHLDGRSG